MSIRHWPNIDSIEDIKGDIRQHLVAVFKCTGSGWVELATGTFGTVDTGTPAYQPSVFGGWEQTQPSAGAMIRFSLSDIPRALQTSTFTLMALSSDPPPSSDNNFGQYSDGYNVGWRMRQTTTNLAFTKAFIADLTFSSLGIDETTGAQAVIYQSNEKVLGVLETATQEDSNTTSLITSPTYSHMSIGGIRIGGTTYSGLGNFGPYVFLWDDALPVDLLQAFMREPDRFIRNRLLEMIPTWGVAASGAYTLAANSGSYTYNGTAASVEFGANLAANSGSYTYTGTAAALNYGFSLAADSGSYTYSGTAAALTADSQLPADSGTYTYSGAAAALEFGANLAAASGSYTYTGTAVTLTFASAGNFTLTADSGAYTYTGTAAALDGGFSLPANSGSYTYTGTAAALDRGYPLTADSGSYAYSGTAATFTRALNLAASSGAYAYTGANVVMTSSGQRLNPAKLFMVAPVEQKWLASYNRQIFQA